MALSQTEREQRDVSMFGILSADLRNIAETSLYRAVSGEKHGDALLAMSILSDSQECMSHGDTETARQYVNRAKYIINHYIMDRE